MDEKETRMVIPRPGPTRELSVSSPPGTLSFRRDSRSSIAKPKIRIIHIFAPEIIKTDTANFRDLVQRLTGKQPDHARPRSSSKSRGRMNGKPSSSVAGVVAPEKPKPRDTTERLDVFLGLEQRERQAVKEEQAGGYLKDFADLDDGFTRELGGLQPPSMDAPLPHALL
ncbi:hypothetical protein MLD38_015948 [Melastoma candidum]|uniref:Uncharacterized protein n=1 Tax=Melastoma candidum TaxID=119954 RepID=A0ACB9RKW0_9MYRT|nr:hypothetical protein MLD38_015948 [Melastoma candidum]